MPDATDDRVAALERQVAELTERLSARDEARYDRRQLLRRTGAVLAAGMTGAVALPSITGAPVASAAEGDPLLAGRTTDAGGAATGLTGGSATGPTLSLGNPVPSGPALRLSPVAGGGLDAATSSAGDLTSSDDLLWYSHTSAGPTGEAATGAVYTSAFANHLEFLQEPRRVLDTRPGGSTDDAGNPVDRRTRVAAGQFVSGGRVAAGSSVVLDLSGLITGGAGVFVNLTVVAPTGPGYVTAYPTPEGTARTDGLDRPAASNLNFGRGVGSLANAALVRLGAGSRISLFTTTVAHLLVDLTAVSVFEPFSLRSGGAALRRAR